MLAKRIIPCLDVKSGRVVKGIKFQGLKDVGDPAELAAAYEKQGADEVVFLDITATQEGRRTLLEVVRRTAERLFIPLTVGGGVRTFEDVRDLLRAGADKVSLNTAAVEKPKLIPKLAREFGSQCVVVAIDAKGRRVYTRAGTKSTPLDVVEWSRQVAKLGAGEILLTCIDRDGTTDGYDEKLTRDVADAVTIPVIASGGCGSPAHIRDVLTRGRASAALAASIFHYGRYTVAQVKKNLKEAGLCVR